MTIDQIRETLHAHFKAREDLYHVVTGPKRETWFSAECISALARVQSGSFEEGERISGEENWDKLFDHCGISSPANPEGIRAIPDISSLAKNDDGSLRLLWLAEVKLVDDWLFDLGNVAKEQDLATQLTRACGLTKDIPVYGLVFVVHISGRGDEEMAMLKAKVVRAKAKHKALKLRKAPPLDVLNAKSELQAAQQSLEEARKCNEEENRLVDEGYPRVDCFETGGADSFFDWVQATIKEGVLLPDGAEWMNGGIEPVVHCRPPLGGQWEGNVSLGLGIVLANPI